MRFSTTPSSTGYRRQSPTRRAPRRKVERKHYPAVTDLAGVGAILRDARAADPARASSARIILLAFTALRVSEVVGAKWDEFDLDGIDVAIGDGRHKEHDPNAGNWRVPRERMKRKDKERGPHVVPLPPALLASLREWRRADGADAVYVCPAPRDPSKPITPEAAEKHYRNGYRLAASTRRIRGARHSRRSAAMPERTATASKRNSITWSATRLPRIRSRGAARAAKGASGVVRKHADRRARWRDGASAWETGAAASPCPRVMAMRLCARMGARYGERRQNAAR